MVDELRLLDQVQELINIKTHEDKMRNQEGQKLLQQSANEGYEREALHTGFTAQSIGW